MLKCITIFSNIIHRLTNIDELRKLYGEYVLKIRTKSELGEAK